MKGTLLIVAATLAALVLASCGSPSNSSSSSWPRGGMSGSRYSRGYQPSSNSRFGSSYGRSTNSSSSSGTSSGLLDSLGDAAGSVTSFGSDAVSSLADLVCKVKPGG